MVIHHESIIDNDSFKLINSGEKRVKFYLNDEKRSGLKSTDFIKYIDNGTNHSVIVLVNKIIHAKNSDILADKMGYTDSQKTEFISYINNWFTIDDQIKYGLIAVQIEKEGQ